MFFLFYSILLFFAKLNFSHSKFVSSAARKFVNFIQFSSYIELMTPLDKIAGLTKTTWFWSQHNADNFVNWMKLRNLQAALLTNLEGENLVLQNLIKCWGKNATINVLINLKICPFHNLKSRLFVQCFFVLLCSFCSCIKLILVNNICIKLISCKMLSHLMIVEITTLIGSRHEDDKLASSIFCKRSLNPQTCQHHANFQSSLLLLYPFTKVCIVDIMPISTLSVTQNFVNYVHH